MTNLNGHRTRLSQALGRGLRIRGGIGQGKSSANQSPSDQEPLPDAGSQSPVAETDAMATAPLASAREAVGRTHPQRKRGERHGVVEITIATDR